MLIGLTGKKRAGKDSVASILARHGFARVAFADPLKEAALIADPYIVDDYRLSAVVNDIGWERAKEVYPEVRRTLQNFGMGIRALDEGFWTRVAQQRIDGLLAQGRDVVVTDVRFPNELDLIHDLDGVHVHVDRPGLVANDPHPSEVVLEPYYARAEATLSNGGTLDDLALAVDEVLPVLRVLTGDHLA